MSGILFLNGADAKTTYGFDLVEAPELLSMGGHTYQTAAVVQRAGVLLGTTRPTIEPRQLRLQGFITGSSLSDAVSKLDNLKAAITSRPCSIRTAWDDTRQYWGVLTAAPAAPNSAYWQTYLAVELDFLLFDPLAYKTTSESVSFTTATAIPLGTATSKGNISVPSKIRITGAASFPILTYKNSAGATIAEMSFTGYSPLASDFIEIDLARGLVTKSVSGQVSNAMNALAPGWNFPALDPADGVYLTSTWPTLEITSVLGPVGTGLATYTKAYR
jgi:phage-related protein